MAKTPAQTPAKNPREASHANASLKRSFGGGGQGRFVVKDVLVHLRSYTISFQENCRVQCFIVLGGVRRVHFQKTSTKAPNNPKGR